MADPPKIVFGGGYEPKIARSISNEQWNDIESRTGYKLSAEVRQKIVDRIHRYDKDVAAYESMPRATALLRRLVAWNRLLSKVISEWENLQRETSKNSDWNLISAVERVMRAFRHVDPTPTEQEPAMQDGRAVAKRSPKQLKALFRDIAAVQRELAAGVSHLKKATPRNAVSGRDFGTGTDNPNVEKKVLPWNELVCDLGDILEAEGGNISVRNDDFAEKRPSPFVLFVRLLPISRRASARATAQAIIEARSARGK